MYYKKNVEKRLKSRYNNFINLNEEGIRMHKRSVGMAILLSLVTCGIYGFFWMYSLADDLIAYNSEEDSAGTEILLGIISCGVYFYYWYYKMGKRVYNAQLKAHGEASDESVLYLILAIFGLGIISQSIMQSKVNKI
jgi:hypothetical protein